MVQQVHAPFKSLMKMMTESCVCRNLTWELIAMSIIVADVVVVARDDG